MAAGVSELDGGVLIEIPELPFSKPTIAIHRRGCGRSCGKTKVCRDGRCVKKHRKKHGKGRKH